MKNTFDLNFGMVVSIAFFLCIAYCLLLSRHVPTSLYTLMAIGHHLSFKKQAILVGILPIYVALFTFGSGLLGAKLGASIQHLLLNHRAKTRPKAAISKRKPFFISIFL